MTDKNEKTKTSQALLSVIKEYTIVLINANSMIRNKINSRLTIALKKMLLCLFLK